MAAQLAGRLPNLGHLRTDFWDKSPVPEMMLPNVSIPTDNTKLERRRAKPFTNEDAAKFAK